MSLRLGSLTSMERRAKDRKHIFVKEYIFSVDNAASVIVARDNKQDRDRTTRPYIDRIFCDLVRAFHGMDAFSVALSLISPIHVPLQRQSSFIRRTYFFPFSLSHFLPHRPCFTAFVTASKESLIRENACDLLREELALIQRTWKRETRWASTFTLLNYSLTRESWAENF